MVVESPNDDFRRPPEFAVADMPCPKSKESLSRASQSGESLPPFVATIGQGLRDPQIVLTGLCLVFLVVSFFVEGVWAAYTSVGFGSYFALKEAWGSLRQRSLDVNFLMVFAAAGSVALGHPVEAAVLLFLFSLSSTLESFAMSRTKAAIESLMHLRPDTALRLGADADERVTVAELQVGDRVRVLPYDQVPIDGEILEGSSSIDEATMTGESTPVEKEPGDRVFAGTQNLDGMLVVSVTAAVGDTALEKIVDLVRDAQENKASGERISQWFGQRYTFFVIGAFGVSLAIRLGAGQDIQPALFAALTLLVALSPCALVISTPASTLSALAWAARNGMLIRGGEFIEAAGRIDTIAMDKTGTLTLGKPRLVDMCLFGKAPVGELVGSAKGHVCSKGTGCWHDGAPMSDAARAVLRLAAAVEQYSTHPIAQAIVLAARESGVDVPESTSHKVHSGLGVEAIVDDTKVLVGRARMFKDLGFALPGEVLGRAEEMESHGMTVAILLAGDQTAALALSDQPRPEAKAVVEQLRSMGVRRTFMLTGDSEVSARAVAAAVGIDEVHAGLYPEQKDRLIADVVGEGARVAMVGDGVNDAPSLTRAHLGIAMGGLGSDVALNSADVVLMRDRLEMIPRLVRLGRMTNRVIRANLFFATGMIVVLTVMTFVFGALFPGRENMVLPLAVVGHEGSTVIVILNGLRLLRGPGGV